MGPRSSATQLERGLSSSLFPGPGEQVPAGTLRSLASERKSWSQHRPGGRWPQKGQEQTAPVRCPPRASIETGVGGGCLTRPASEYMVGEGPWCFGTDGGCDTRVTDAVPRSRRLHQRVWAQSRKDPVHIHLQHKPGASVTRHRSGATVSAPVKSNLICCLRR